MKQIQTKHRSQLLVIITMFLAVVVSFNGLITYPVFSMTEAGSLPPGSLVEPGPPTTGRDTAEPWRHKVPVLPPPRPFKLPTITSYTLSNGLSVQLLPDHRVPFVTVALGIKAGSDLDPPSLLGLSGMTADMLTEGTASQSSKQIADEVDFIGGALQAAADPDNTILSGSALSQYTPRLINVFADVLLHPSFPEDELKLKKTNLIHELAIKRSEPDFLLDERFNKVVFGKHPYSITAPTQQTVARLTRNDLQKFHEQYYRPNIAYLVVVGDFDLESMKKIIGEKFATTWKENNVSPVIFQPAPKQRARKIYLIDRPGSVQSAIKIGNVSISRNDPDYFPLLVANHILGGATNSRLFLNLREQKGYTYGAYSGVDARRQPGSIAAEAEVRTEVTAPSLEEFLYELDRLRNIKVSEKELNEAKSHLAGSFQLGLETQSALASRLLERKLYDLANDYLETYVDKVMAVTADQIRQMARKHIDLAQLVICVVGDKKKIEPDLEYFAGIDTYDANGNILAKQNHPSAQSAGLGLNH